MKKTGIVLIAAAAAAIFAFAGGFASYRTQAAAGTAQTVSTNPSYVSVSAETASRYKDAAESGGETYGQVEEGASGEAVARLQTELKDLGYLQADATGYFGTDTRSALIAFQEANGLTPDGIAGATTWSALNSGSAAAA